MMATMPDTDSDTNHSTISGPKVSATRSVPLLWITNRTAAIQQAIMTRIPWLILSRPGISTRPSTALRILIAGVIMPSADQQRNTDVSQQRNEGNPATSFEQRYQDLFQDDGTAFAFFSEAHGEPGIFHRHQSHQCPDNQRERTPITCSADGLVRRNMTLKV